MKNWRMLALALVLGFAACGGDGATVTQICQPNKTQPCSCVDGSIGAQACLEDGSGWAMCTGCAIPVEDIREEEDTYVPDINDIKVPEEIAPEVTPEVIPDVEQPEVLPFVCLLNNCSEDAHCTGCSDGRRMCLVAESRCVACIPGTDQGCKDGEVCSSWGICAPAMLTCPTNPSTNEPTVVCMKNADCQACSPMHQVCDTVKHVCTGCSATNTSHCLKSDVCIDGKCSPRCPASCELDNDCMFCGPPEKPLHACNKHKCTECSATWPCPAGLVCLPNGVCHPPCGLPGPVSGTCSAEEDCHWCGDPKAPGTWVCRTPINDPVHGSCQPPAEGCEDLGAGVAVLPEPWSDYTQLCSNDENCAYVGATINLGKVIRDIAGTNEVMGIAIGNANVTYPMRECAEIKITNNINCGICVPCDEDSDCAPVSVDPLIPALFPNDPLVQIAGAILIDMLWGNAPDHNLNFYCQPVAMGYGVCAPCANPLQTCGKTGGGGSGNCNHDVCTVGDALDPSCGSCAAEVCANDDYCCNVAWDAMCVAEVDTFCASPCGGGGGCAVDICTNDDLPAQNVSCGPCVAAVCAEDPFCCNTTSGAWDGYCIQAAALTAVCEPLCGGGCAHDVCVMGGPLDPGCSSCAASVCDDDDWCCTYEWDSICVDMAIADMACPCI